jgi:hypothetical protein
LPRGSRLDYLLSTKFRGSEVEFRERFTKSRAAVTRFGCGEVESHCGLTKSRDRAARFDEANANVRERVTEISVRRSEIAAAELPPHQPRDQQVAVLADVLPHLATDHRALVAIRFALSPRPLAPNPRVAHDPVASPPSPARCR